MGSDDRDAWIVVLEGGATPGTVRALRYEPRRRFLLGRSKTCELPVVDDAVGRRHTLFETDDAPTGQDVWFCSDMGSTNGTSVNFEKIRRVPLRDGDRVSLGKTLVRFFVGAGAESRAEAAAREAREIAREDARLDPAARAEHAFVAALRRAADDARARGSPLALLMVACHPTNASWLEHAAGAVFPLATVVPAPGDRVAILLRAPLDDARAEAERLRRFADASARAFMRVGYAPTLSVGIAPLGRLRGEGVYRAQLPVLPMLEAARTALKDALAAGGDAIRSAPLGDEIG